MTKQKKRKRGTAIYAFCLIVYTLLLVLVAFYALTQVWQYAESFELARPTRTMDAYIADLSASLWDDSMAATVAAMPHEVQTDEECKELVRAMLNDELSYSRMPGGNNGESIRYALLCGGNAFGQVSLVQDDSQGDSAGLLGSIFGDQRPWKVDKEEFDFNGLYSSVQITVPESYSVKLNDITLGEQYIIERDIPYDVLEDYYAQYPQLPTKVTYRFDNVFGHLDPVVYNEQGEETVIDKDQDDSQFIKPVDESVFRRLENFSRNFADTYLAFSSTVYDPVFAYGKLAPYIMLGGDLDDRLHLVIDDHAGSRNWLHTGSYRFDSCALDKATDVGDGYYILEITAVTTTTFPNHGENGIVTDHNGLTVIVKDTAGEIRAVAVERYEADGS